MTSLYHHLVDTYGNWLVIAFFGALLVMLHLASWIGGGSE